MSSLLYEGKSDRLPFRYSRYYFFSRNRNYFLITSSIENNLIDFFITPSQTGLNQKQFFVVVESRSILHSSKIVYKLTGLLDITGS